MALNAPGDLAGAEASRTRHIAIFMYQLTGGGAQRRALVLANALAARGHRVDFVLISAQTRFRDELSPAVRLLCLESPEWGGLHARLHRLLPYRWVRVYLGMLPLIRYISRERPAVLLSAANRVTLAAVLAWRLAGRPLPLVLRASNYPLANLDLWPPLRGAVRQYLRWLANRIYPDADAVIAVSDGVAEAIIRLTGLSRARITTIYNPVVDAALLEKTREPIEHPWFAPGEPPVVLSVGRFRIQKDFPTLIRAFALVRRARPARLMILGDGTQRRALESLVKSLGLGSDVALPGYAENPLPRMRRASVFVLSSAWEGLPGVLIEALAAGCPVVSTDCPSGPSEILDRGAYGPLVPSRDPDALAQAILSVLENPPDRERLRRRAELFSVDVAVDKYLAVFEACILRWQTRTVQLAGIAALRDQER
jgi:glycosyltransferase involved in cell wall biosynthesis